ncbi:hypothetical protein RhiLY_12460 [Ceratobasidium sp. AG-Ba]|nr:hypothetical protein RhiLY_12460 [Ceratobasidium sp. AG-Ba]
MPNVPIETVTTAAGSINEIKAQAGLEEFGAYHSDLDANVNETESEMNGNVNAHSLTRIPSMQILCVDVQIRGDMATHSSVESIQYGDSVSLLQASLSEAYYEDEDYPCATFPDALNEAITKISAVFETSHSVADASLPSGASSPQLPLELALRENIESYTLAEH